jgi:hypothetical protein
VRLTSSISDNSRSDGSRSPAFSSPLTSLARIASQISSKIRRRLQSFDRYAALAWIVVAA